MIPPHLFNSGQSSVAGGSNSGVTIVNQIGTQRDSYCGSLSETKRAAEARRTQWLTEIKAVVAIHSMRAEATTDIEVRRLSCNLAHISSVDEKQQCRDERRVWHSSSSSGTTIPQPGVSSCSRLPPIGHRPSRLRKWILHSPEVLRVSNPERMMQPESARLPRDGVGRYHRRDARIGLPRMTSNGLTSSATVCLFLAYFSPTRTKKMERDAGGVCSCL